MKGMPAKAYNKFVDAAKWVENQTSPGPYGKSPIEDIGKLYEIVNSLELDLARGEIVGISDVAVTPTDNQDEYENGMLFDIALPDVDDHANSWAIIYDDLGVEDGIIGRATMSGPAITTVNMIADTHKYCRLVQGDKTKLDSSAEDGYPILWVDSGTGLKDAVVFVGPYMNSGAMLCQASESLAANSVAEITSMSTISGTDQRYYTIRKPTADSLNQVVSVRYAIASGAFGSCRFPGDIEQNNLVTVTGSPAIGDTVGTANGSGSLAAGKEGFVFLGESGGLSRIRPFSPKALSDVTVHNGISSSYIDWNNIQNGWSDGHVLDSDWYYPYSQAGHKSIRAYANPTGYVYLFGDNTEFAEPLLPPSLTVNAYGGSQLVEVSNSLYIDLDYVPQVGSSVSVSALLKGDIAKTGYGESVELGDYGSDYAESRLDKFGFPEVYITPSQGLYIDITRFRFRLICNFSAPSSSPAADTYMSIDWNSILGTIRICGGNLVLTDP